MSRTGGEEGSEDVDKVEHDGVREGGTGAIRAEVGGAGKGRWMVDGEQEGGAVVREREEKEGRVKDLYVLVRVSSDPTLIYPSKLFSTSVKNRPEINQN